MLKQRSILEVKIADKTYELHCDNDSPLGSLHDALYQMKAWALNRMEAVHKEQCQASEAKQPEENKQEVDNG